MNAIDLLKSEHKIVLRAIDAILEEETVDDMKLLQVADQLVAHMVIEEHVFYPRVREMKAELVAESFEEHTVARFELGRAILAERAEKKARVTVLKDLLEHHMDDEERQMFPKVRAGVSARELDALGERMKTMFDKATKKGFSRLVVEGYTLRGGARAASSRVVKTTGGIRGANPRIAGGR